MSLIAALRSFDPDRNDLDDMVALWSQGEQLVQSYEAVQLPVPEFVNEAVYTLRTEIGNRRRDELARRRKQLLAKRESLKTKDQQLVDINAELAALDQALS